MTNSEMGHTWLVVIPALLLAVSGLVLLLATRQADTPALLISGAAFTTMFAPRAPRSYKIVMALVGLLVLALSGWLDEFAAFQMLEALR